VTIGLALLLASAPTLPAQPAAIAACTTWLAKRVDEPGSAIVVRLGESLCFDGRIDAASVRAFRRAAGALPWRARPTIVLRSIGGEVGASLEIAEAIEQMDATVAAYQLCISSCANYLLAAGRRRIVLPATLLGFHGGARPADPAQLAEFYRDAGAADPARDAADTAAHFQMLVARQAAFLRRRGIDPEFLSWMVRFNDLPSAQQDRICPYSGEIAFLVFAPAVLARHGYRIDEYGGPRSDDETRQAMLAERLPGGAACYVGSDEADF
jgi:hypothetical protein